MAASIVRRVDAQGGVRLGFLQRDPRGIAAGVKLGAVRSTEDRHEWIVWAPVAPTMSAPAERRGLEMVVDPPHYFAAFVEGQANDLGVRRGLFAIFSG